MGYSHQWYHTREFSNQEWQTVMSIASELIRKCGELRIGLHDGSGSAPVVTAAEIAFNGEMDCEVMQLKRGPDAWDQTRHQRRLEMWGDEGGAPKVPTVLFSYCKTNGLPYDIAVVALLAAVEMVFPGVLLLHSNGAGTGKLDGGITLARQVVSQLMPGKDLVGPVFR